MVERSTMLNMMLGCYNKVALETIKRAVKIFLEVAITNKFEDDPYNRSHFPLWSCSGRRKKARLNQKRPRLLQSERPKKSLGWIHMRDHCPFSQTRDRQTGTTGFKQKASL